MTTLHVDGKTIALDPEGFLLDLSDWNETVAAVLAAREDLVLTPAHREIIHLLQQFHRQFGHSPPMRVLVKYVQQQLGPEKGTSLYLLQLFPGSPAKRIARIGGLPRPANCL